MKKTTALAIICVLLLAAWMPAWALAADGPTFSAASNISAERGRTVTVPVSVSDNPGFAAVGLVVTYNANALELTGVTGSVGQMPLSSQFAITTSPGTQWVSLINPNSEDWRGSGTVAEVTFNVRSGAPAGTSSIGLSFTSTPDGTPADAEGNILRSAWTNSGSVYIYDAWVDTLAQPQVQPPEIAAPPPMPPDPLPSSGGEFIGAADVPVIEPPAPVPISMPDMDDPQDPGEPPEPPEDFGEVPQTGVSDTWPLIALGISLAASAALWARALRRRDSGRTCKGG